MKHIAKAKTNIMLNQATLKLSLELSIFVARYEGVAYSEKPGLELAHFGSDARDIT